MKNMVIYHPVSFPARQLPKLYRGLQRPIPTHKAPLQRLYETHWAFTLLQCKPNLVIINHSKKILQECDDIVKTHGRRDSRWMGQINTWLINNRPCETNNVLQTAVPFPCMLFQLMPRGPDKASVCSDELGWERFEMPVSFTTLCVCVWLVRSFVWWTHLPALALLMRVSGLGVAPWGIPSQSGHQWKCRGSVYTSRSPTYTHTLYWMSMKNCQHVRCSFIWAHTWR